MFEIDSDSYMLFPRDLDAMTECCARAFDARPPFYERKVHVGPSLDGQNTHAVIVGIPTFF